MKEGDTGRARHFAETIRNVDRLVDASQDALERFRDHGRDEDLEIRADRGGRFGADQMTETAIFTSLGHHSYEVAPEL